MEDKENLCRSRSRVVENRNVLSPNKTKRDQTRSPGPKVAKLLELFTNPSSRSCDGDDDNQNEENKLRYDFEQCPQVKKMKAAQAARLNESYREASEVICKLLESDNEAADTDEDTEPIVVKTTENVKKADVNNVQNEEKSGFDVQNFLKNLHNKSNDVEAKETVGAVRLEDKFEFSSTAFCKEESPRPTAALAYFHLVSSAKTDTPHQQSKRPKLGASEKMQSLLSSFENMDDPIRPPKRATAALQQSDLIATGGAITPTKQQAIEENKNMTSGGSKSDCVAKEHVSAAATKRTAVDSDNGAMDTPEEKKAPLTPKRPISSKISNMITQLQSGASRTSESESESDEEDHNPQSQSQSKDDPNDDSEKKHHQSSKPTNETNQNIT